MRSFAALVVSSALLFGLAACGDDDDDTDAGGNADPAAGPSTTVEEGAVGEAECEGSGEGMTIGFVAPLPDPNFELLEQVIRSDAEAKGRTLLYANASLDANKQQSDLTTMLAQGADALIVSPVDPAAVQAVLDQARAANVPIVTLDTQVGGGYATNIQNRVYEAGAAAADKLAELVGDGGTVALVEGPGFAEPLVQRNNGFKERAAEIGLTIVATQATLNPNDPGVARGFADAWKTQFADLGGIWAVNDQQAIGAASAVDGSWDPVVVGINAEPPAIDAIKAGEMAATFDLHPVVMGRALQWAAVQAFCQGEMPSQINIEATLVDESNVDQWIPWEEQREMDFKVEFRQGDDGAYLVTDDFSAPVAEGEATTTTGG